MTDRSYKLAAFALTGFANFCVGRHPARRHRRHGPRAAARPGPAGRPGPVSSASWPRCSTPPSPACCWNDKRASMSAALCGLRQVAFDDPAAAIGHAARYLHAQRPERVVGGPAANHQHLARRHRPNVGNAKTIDHAAEPSGCPRWQYAVDALYGGFAGVGQHLLKLVFTERADKLAAQRPGQGLPWRPEGPWRKTWKIPGRLHRQLDGQARTRLITPRKLQADAALRDIANGGGPTRFLGAALRSRLTKTGDFAVHARENPTLHAACRRRIHGCWRC